MQRHTRPLVLAALAALLVAALMPGAAAQGTPIGFSEEFALSTDRSRALFPEPGFEKPLPARPEERAFGVIDPELAGFLAEGHDGAEARQNRCADGDGDLALTSQGMVIHS